MSESSRIVIDLCHVAAINFEINMQATHKYDFFCIQISLEFLLAEVFRDGHEKRGLWDPKRLITDAEMNTKRNTKHDLEIPAKGLFFCCRKYRVTLTAKTMFWLFLPSINETEDRIGVFIEQEQQMVLVKVSQVVGICHHYIQTLAQEESTKRMKSPLLTQRDVKLTFNRERKNLWRWTIHKTLFCTWISVPWTYKCKSLCM